jgi:hypothetical protein
MEWGRAAAFFRGYGRYRDASDFHDHFEFWAIAVLCEAAVFRITAMTPQATIPLDRLKELLAEDRRTGDLTAVQR